MLLGPHPEERQVILSTQKVNFKFQAMHNILVFNELLLLEGRCLSQCVSPWRSKDATNQRTGLWSSCLTSYGWEFLSSNTQNFTILSHVTINPQRRPWVGPTNRPTTYVKIPSLLTIIVPITPLQPPILFRISSISDADWKVGKH